MYHGNKKSSFQNITHQNTCSDQTREAPFVKVQGEITYLHDISHSRGVNKQEKRLSMNSPLEVKSEVIVNASKMRDVEKLLKNYYGSIWYDIDKLNWYRKWFGCRMRTH